MKQRLGALAAILAIPLVATLVTAGARDMPPAPGIQVLGFDRSAGRVYYLVSEPFTRLDPAVPESLYRIRTYDTGDSTDGQATTSFFAADRLPDKRAELFARVDSLRLTLEPMAPVDSVDGLPVPATNGRAKWFDDVGGWVADYRVDFRGLSGAWTSYAVCNDPMVVSVRRIHLTKDGKHGLAIIQNTGRPGCEFIRALLLSTRAVPPSVEEWTQVP